LRELRGTESQASFSSALGINRIQYAKYEAGKNAPSIEVLERICRVHACSADWLLGLNANESSSVNVANSPGAAVANGRNARASVGPNCEQCPFKLLAMEFKDRAAKLPRKR
jgi:transcriptional regulator with XRE-family HTH domain